MSVSHEHFDCNFNLVFFLLCVHTEDVNVEEEETLAKEDEDTIKDTNVSTTEGEQEELKVEEVCCGVNRS